MKKSIIVPVIVAIVFAGGGFYAGMQYQQSAATAARASRAGQFAGAGGAGFRTGGMRGAGGFVAGKVIKSDATSITVQQQDGSTKIVLMGTSTQVMKSASGSVADLTAGTNVVVTGTSNSDGSETAQSVQIRPAPPAASNAAPQVQ